jgi:hypothetical protein
MKSSVVDVGHQDIDFDYIPYSVSAFAGPPGQMQQLGQTRDIDFHYFKQKVAVEPNSALAGASLAFSVLFASSSMFFL